MFITFYTKMPKNKNAWTWVSNSSLHPHRKNGVNGQWVKLAPVKKHPPKTFHNPFRINYGKQGTANPKNLWSIPMPTMDRNYRETQKWEKSYQQSQTAQRNKILANKRKAQLKLWRKRGGPKPAYPVWK